MSRWEIIKKEISGIEVVAYTIKSEDDSTKRVSIEDATLLARNGMITNASAKLNTVSGRYILDIDDSNLVEENYNNKEDKLHIVCRLIDNENKCVGYKVKDDNGKSYKLSSSKTWELAEKQTIVGIKAVIKGNKRCLISTEDCVLEDLPISKI